MNNLESIRLERADELNPKRIPASQPWAERRNPTGMVTAWCLLAIMMLGAAPARAQFPSTYAFSNDFNGVLPFNVRLTGTATVNGGYLKLTTQTPGGQLGTAFIDGLPATQGVQSFRATFRAALFGGTIPPADGFSFNLAPAITTPIGTGPGEEGTTNGLTISFDTFDNGGEPPSISVRWNGILMGEQPVQVSTSPGGITDPASRLRDFSIQLDPDGTIDVIHNGVVIFNNLPSGYVPIYGGRWVLSARTGGLADNHWFDDLNITATLETPPALVTGSSLSLAGGYVEVSRHPTLALFPLSVTAWIRTTAAGQSGRQTIVSHFDETTGAGYGLLIEASPSGNRLRGFCSGPGGLAVGGDVIGSDVSDGQWHHVAFTAGPSGAKLYVDGALTGQDTFEEVVTNAADVPLRLGADNSGASPFYGQMDEVTLWNVELNPSAVATTRLGAMGTNATGLVAYWRFDEGVGATVADVTGHGHPGKLIGQAGWQLQPGPDLSRIAAAQLDLNGSYVQLPQYAPFDSYPLTLAAWVRTAEISAGRRGIISKYNPGAAQGYSLYLENGQLGGVYARPGGLNQIRSSNGSGVPGGFIADDAWHYVAFTVDTDGGRLYVDGQLRGSLPWTGTAGATATTVPLVLGYNGSPGTEFRGSLDEVSVWNIALHQNTIRTYATVPPAGNESGLLAYYRLNEGMGATLYDATTNHLDGRFAGTVAPAWAPESTPLGVLAAGRAGDFNGNVITVPHDPALNGLPLTIMTWFRTTNTLPGLYQSVNIVRKGVGGQGFMQMSIYQFNPNIPASMNLSYYEPLEAEGVDVDGRGVAAGDGRWHHVAFVLDPIAATATAYVDGVRRQVGFWSTLTPRSHGSTLPLLIGSPEFRGQLDEMSIWNQALSEGQILGLWRQPLTGTEPGLIAYYPFNESGGTNLVDASGHGHNGTMTSAIARIASDVRLLDNTTIRGQITTTFGGVTNIPVSAVLGPVEGPGLLSIPDQGAVESTNLVVATGAIGVLKVTANITHPFSGDLEVTLIHPDGTQVRLKNPDINDDSLDWLRTFSTTETSGAALVPLLGKSASGAWRLRVRDVFGEDTGMLNSWSLGAGPGLVFTDVLGAYAFTNLLPAIYTVQPERPGFVFSPPSQVALSSRSGVNFELISGFIAGRVTGFGGAPLAGVTISGAGVTVTTDDRGEYRLAPVAPAGFTLTALLAGHGFEPSQLSPLLGTTNANFVTVGYPVAGRVVDLSSNGVPGVSVSAGGRSAVTDEGGNYSIAQVPQGSQVVTPSRGTAIFTPVNRTVTSGPAVSGVNFVLQSAPPTITPLSDRVIARNTSTGPLRFDVDDRETRPGFLTVSARSGNQTLVPDANIVLGGVGEARTATVTPAANVSGVATITITVTDGSGLSASESFDLRVNAVPIAGVGGALSLSGTADYVIAATNAPVLDRKGNFAVELWASAPANNGARTLVSQGSGTNFFALATDASGQLVVSDTWNTGVPFPFGGWHHLAVVKETGNARLYIDGVLRASRGSTLPLPDASAAFRVGAKSSAPATGRWLGGVDELRVWGMARTASEVASNLNTRVVGTEDGLRLLWRFDERSGPAVLDVSSNALQGATQGSPVRTQAEVLFSHYVTTEDTPIRDVLQAWDPDDDTLTFQLVTSPQRGTVTLLNTNTGAFLYSPNANASGADRFSFSVSDGYAETEVSLVTIEISPDTNAPSISFVGSQTTAEDTALGPLAFSVRDPEVVSSNLVVFGLCSVPSLVPPEGFVFSGSGSNRTVTIRPATNANGSATISLVVSDGKLTATNNFTLTVTPVNDAPVFLSTPTNMVVRRNQTSPAQPFTVNDVDNPLDALQLSASSFNSLVPLATVIGTGPNRAISVVGAALQSGSTTVNVIMSDGILGTFVTFNVIVNEPPTIDPIPNQSTLTGRPTGPIAIRLNDVDNAFTDLTLAAVSSNPLLVAPSGFAFSGTGQNRTLVITPLSGQIGSAVIRLVASDGRFSSTNTFTLFVEESFDYTLTDLPEPAGSTESLVEDMSDQGLAVGYVAFADAIRAVSWDLTSTQPQLNQLFPDSGFAVGVNNSGDIIGLRGNTNFLFRNGNLSRPLTADNPPFDINNAGIIVGGFLRVLEYIDGAQRTNLVDVFSVLTDLGDLFGYFDGSLAPFVVLNDGGDVFGRSVNRDRALVWQANADGSRTLRDLGGFGGTLIAAGGINNAGDVCINVFSNGNYFPLIYNFRRSVLVTNLLPALSRLVPAGVSASYYATDINGSGEVVGYITTNGAAGASGRFAGFLYADGRAVNLQSLVAANATVPLEPKVINETGDIAGRGIKAGVGGRHAFVLRRNVLVGRPLSPPALAINPATQRAYQAPQVEAIDGTPPDQAVQAWTWSDLEQKLYFVRPMAARVTWVTTAITSDPNAPSPVVRVMRAVLPADAQIHVAGAPVEVEPLSASSPYRALAMSYSSVPGAEFDPGSKRLRISQPGYSVLRYLIAPETLPGATPDPATHTNYFQVVRSVAWNDPAYLRDNVAAIVGTKVGDPRGPSVATNSPKSGWVVNLLSPYDGVGGDAAYNRATQSGPIVPVNKDGASAEDDLVVAFYKVHPVTGALWPDLPVRFNISWPANAEKLVIANPDGSGALPPAQFPDKRVYVQSSTNLPGYNPNEEHAFLAPTKSGEGVFALRNDLNSDATSRSFVLLKFRDPATQEWRFKPYEVVLTDASHGFRFAGEAGQEILPPYPLSLLPLCPDTSIVSGNAFRDHRGKLYGIKGPTPGDPNPQVIIRYFYPLQPTFYYDLNRDGTNDFALGNCVGWSGIAPDTATAVPVQVTYDIHWPTNTPALEIGETLLTAKRGLPGIKNWASAQVVFDTLNPSGNNTLSTTARLYDPLSTRTIRLTNVAGITASYRFPSEVALETRGDGKQIFSGLPYYLRTRLTYDPINRWLSWSGVLSDNVLGEPLLLINVMSDAERQRIKQLTSEAKFHNIIDALYDLTRNPNRLDLDHDTAPDQDLLIGFTTNSAGQVVQEDFGSLPKALTAGLPLPDGANASGQTNYLVLAENDDPALGALPVTLHVIRVEGGPFRGDLKLLFPDNVFDERLTLRHSSDFGGDPDRLQFEWWYHSDDADFDPVALPVTSAPTGEVIDPRGWRLYKPAAFGQNSITLGDGAETSLFTLVDNWFIVRYRGYNVAGATNWSEWVGDPSSTVKTRASFAPGWVKRVVEGINPFEARTTNFHDNASVTYASMLIQAGERYEGDIALNPSGGNLNSIGLIEAYTTVLNRGKRLSIDGLPPVDSDPANNALLLAASRLADLYVLLGNEAFSDAQDPTIGFFSDSLEFGTVATSIFAFQNQLDSLLEEELGLLRGRDDSASGVGARPVYNRLLWNFTGAEGEVAYERVYNVGDVNLDGVINENDARILFPQGHGDAWGHYLTAVKTYYDLLRHPRFTWIPRTENVLVAGTAVRVDFLDERKFAATAAQKAKAGGEIVDLTYRSKYVDNPEGQFQGYKDTRPDRAWGVTEWARRVGQGTYFDWLTANAILPSVDPNASHTGIQKIDRQTVLELDEVVGYHHEVQAQLDKVDKGLNPLGLAKGVVPFDIDPSLLLPSSGVQAEGHFEQIYNRAVQAMNNTVTMWNQANSLTEALRRQQDDVDDFTANVADQERDFKSRLIELFGYPYGGDIGPGKTYPSGYDGPDLYHYNYINTTELTGQQPRPRGFDNILGYFKPFQDGTNGASFYFGNDLSTPNIATRDFLTVSFPLAQGDWAFSAPAAYGARRAPGEIQLALSDLLQEETRLKQALNNYDGLIQQIEDQVTLLQSRLALSNSTITLLTGNRSEQVSLNTRLTAAQDGQLALRRISSIVTRIGDAAVEEVPEDAGQAVWFIDDILGSAIKMASIAVSETLEGLADVAEGQANRFEKTKEETQLQTDINVEVASQDFEVRQMSAELRQLLRSEAPLRLETFNQGELVKQSLGRYQVALTTGQRLLTERTIFRQRTAGLAQQNRYKDIAFRIFRNDALQKYRAQFDLAARYVYLAASAYDYELNFLGTDTRGARDFFTDIIRERSLGVMVDGLPITGRTGLSDPLARLKQNFEVLSPRFGLNNPQQETARFSLRKELFRIRDGNSEAWRNLLTKAVVPNLWDVPEFRRYCRPFAPEPAGPQPGIVLRFPTTVTFGLNFFEHALGGGDTAFDPSLFSTKVNSVGVWFTDYNGAGLATAPRVYFFPAGLDVMRSPTGNTLATREYKILDQVVPVPFPIGVSDVEDPTWIPINDSLAESFAQIRRYSSFRAYHDSGVYEDNQSTKDTRLIGRSVWNTDWVLIIPGGTLLNNPEQGLEEFIESVSDILISLQSYSYAGD